MSQRGLFGFSAPMALFAAFGGLSGCSEDSGDTGKDNAETGGSPTGGSTASGGSGGRGGASSTGGVSSNGGTSSGGSGLDAGRGGSNSTAGTEGTGKGGGLAVGGTSADGGRSGSMNGGTGGTAPPGGTDGKSPYEIECHGDTAMCGNPASLLCLGLRVGTDVLGYSCANECQSDANCSDVASSTDAEAGCIDFVNKKYCLLVCKNGDETATCPDDMYCYVYEGTTTGYCLWH